jgi:hypothetical protein
MLENAPDQHDIGGLQLLDADLAADQVSRGADGDAVAVQWDQAAEDARSRQLHPIERNGKGMAGPHRDEAQHNRPANVRARLQPFAILHQVKRLQAEGRERCISSTDSDHDELPRS